MVVLLASIGCQPTHTERVAKTIGTIANPAEISLYEPVSAPGKILLAESLLRQNEIDAALALYRDAVFISIDPEVAKRAAILARQAGAVSDSRDFMNRWRELSPDSIDAIEAQIIFEARYGETETIQKLLNEILARDTDYDSLWIGSIWAGLQDAQKIKFLEAFRLVARQSENSSLAIIVAEIQNQQEKSSGTTWLDQWIEVHPLTANVLLFRARLELPDRDKAIERLEQHPELSSALNIKAQLARWYGLNNDISRAKILLTEITEKDSTRYQDTFTLGLLEMQSEQFDAAELHLKKLLAQEQFRANAYYHLGEVAKKTNRLAVAIDRFLRVDRGEFIVEARKQAAEIAIQGDNAGDAQRWFNEARLLHPHLKAELWLGEAQIQTQNQRADAAIPILNTAIEKTPDKVDLLYMRALAFEQLDQIVNAERDLRTILAQDPSDPDALNALGYTLADRTDRLDEALKMITQALEVKPSSPAILDSMGWVLHKLSRHSEALPYFEQAWEIIQDHEIAAHYGEVLWVLGEREKAREIWDRGYESRPESAIIRATIDRLMNS